MKLFRTLSGGKRKRGGFSLVEAAFSIGFFSFGLLGLAPLLAWGLKTSASAGADRCSSQIAQTLIEEAKQGSLTSGLRYFDNQGGALTSAQAAAFTAESTAQTSAENESLTQLTLRVTPTGHRDHARVYSAVFLTPPPVPTSPPATP